MGHVIDINLIRNDPDAVREALAKRVDDCDLSGILAADQRRRQLLHQVELTRADHKQASREIGRLRAAGADTTHQEATAGQKAATLAALEKEFTEADKLLNDLLSELPNLPDARVPAGDKENNHVVSTWGEKPQLFEGAADHVQPCTQLGLGDYARGTKLGGNGFWLYTGMGAALEWALLDFFCREHIADGYQFLLTPHMLTTESGYAAGQFPKFVDDVFHIADTNSFLLPTAETAVLNVYRDETLPVEQLPLKLFAYTPCYRKEAGSYRSSERGTLRGHQFNKVEMFQFVAPEDSEQALTELLGKAERLMQKLGLHYQTTLLAAEDATASMRLTYDVEVWLPSINEYKEVSSASWAGDYQARRGNIRFRREQGKPTEFVHTLNASGLATSRLVPAIVEQFQQPDGSVIVPEPLRPWLGVDVLRP